MPEILDVKRISGIFLFLNNLKAAVLLRISLFCRASIDGK